MSELLEQALEKVRVVGVVQGDIKELGSEDLATLPYADLQAHYVVGFRNRQDQGLHIVLEGNRISIKNIDGPVRAPLYLKHPETAADAIVALYRAL